MGLDHVGLDVTDYERSRAFYEKALAPLGLSLMMEPVEGVGGFGDGRMPYGAFVLDPDGNNVEAVCHKPG
jgi:catechol 2,3-dioxygenase-like lactoylglutathione lyase family enzyme